MNRREFMKRSGLWAPAAVGLLWPRLAQAASWRIGLNFRSTSGYVTDGADEVYVLATDTTPTERKSANGNSVTFQWDSAPTAANRSNTVDVRLAGHHRTNNPDVRTLTVTLPYTGPYKVRIAAGDALVNYWVAVYLKDNGTTLITLSGSIGNNFFDADGTALSTANWPGSNTLVDVNFASTVCQVVIGPGSATWVNAIAHLYLEYAGGVRRQRRIAQ